MYQAQLSVLEDKDDGSDIAVSAAALGPCTDA
jgi:hypothetical protein